MNSYHNSWIRKTLVLWQETHPEHKESRETAGASTLTGSQWWLQKNNFAPACAEAGFVRTATEEMYFKTGEDVDDGFGNFYCTIPRVHLFSDPSRFCSKTLDTQVYRDWSSSWCPGYLSSWRLWSWQWHWLDKEWKLWRMYLEFRTSKGLPQGVSARTVVIPRSWKWRRRKMGPGKPIRWLSSSNEVVIPHSDVQVALDRRTLKRKSGRNTVHFIADSGNIEFLLPPIHAANQLSIYGVVSSWCIDLAEKMHDLTYTGVDRSTSEEIDQISKQLDPQEVGSLVWNQPMTEEAAGNCWRDHLQRFEMMNLDEQFHTVREEAGSKRPVSKGMYYTQNRGRERWIWKFHRIMHRYTRPRTHRDSEIKLWVTKNTEIGPVRGVKIICHHGRHGIEIQIPSTSGVNTNVWVVISRGSNRFVDELRFRDRENSFEEADCECMQDTDQEQPTIQLDMSNDYLPIPERKWKDIAANEFSHGYTWDSTFFGRT